MHARDVPARLTTGAYVLHAGLDGWNAGEDRAKPLRGMAAGAFYLRTPSLRKRGSVWPTQAETGVSKDVRMLGIGLGLPADPAQAD